MKRMYQTVGECTIAYVRTGAGHPLLLLHGFPQTLLAWHKVMPLLDKHFTLIIPDLPGYGDSIGPNPDELHVAYSKRNMADLLVKFMEQLGFSSFAVAGHDRGGRVAYRMALDHPEVVRKLAVLDILPTGEMADQMNFDVARTIPHWWLLSQPHPFPETLINSNAAYYLKFTIDSWSGNRSFINANAMEDYLRCFKKPAVVRAMCEDYRAGATIDVEQDRENKIQGPLISCPVLVLYPADFFAAGFGDPLLIWKKWARNVESVSVDSSHFLMEEIPERVSEVLGEFFIEKST